MNWAGGLGLEIVGWGPGGLGIGLEARGQVLAAHGLRVICYSVDRFVGLLVGWLDCWIVG